MVSIALFNKKTIGKPMVIVDSASNPTRNERNSEKPLVLCGEIIPPKANPPSFVESCFLFGKKG